MVGPESISNIKKTEFSGSVDIKHKRKEELENSLGFGSGKRTCSSRCGCAGAGGKLAVQDPSILFATPIGHSDRKCQTHRRTGLELLQNLDWLDLGFMAYVFFPQKSEDVDTLFSLVVLQLISHEFYNRLKKEKRQNFYYIQCT